MATMKDIRDGLVILLKYEKLGDGDFSSEHDQCWAGSATEEAVSLEDRAVLDALGWFWDEAVESWSRFT